MLSRHQICDISRLLLVTVTLALCVAAYNDDRPIFKWSPNFFNSYYRRSMYKRFNEDQPYYKWSPQMFQRYAGTFKRSDPEEASLDLCLPPAAPCLPGLQTTQCCGGLHCLPAGHRTRAVCQPVTRDAENDLSVAAGSGSDEPEQDDSPSSVAHSSWYGRGPPPFFPRSWQ